MAPMKLTLHEKIPLETVLQRLEDLLPRLEFSSFEADTARKTIVSFHSMLSTPDSGSINSKFEKLLTGESGKTLKIVGISASQRSLFARLTGR